ncbi:MAG: hypothetical protein WCC64_19525, partial [Aliidongia sp.]
GMTGFLRGLHDLAEEALAPPAAPAVADAAGPDAEFIVAPAHRHSFRMPKTGDGARIVEFIGISATMSADPLQARR